MADHAVGGIDGLIERGAGQSRDSEPQRRRHDRIGEILGEAFDRRAGDAGFVKRRSIAADDVRNCDASGFNAVHFERGRDIGDVPVQAALRNQGAGEDRGSEEPEGNAKQRLFDHKGDRSDDAKNDQNCDNTRKTHAQPSVLRLRGRVG